MPHEVAIVAASYFLVLAVEFLFYEAGVFTYHFALLFTTTAVIYLCSLKITKTLFIYAHLQLILGALYLVLLTDYYLIGDYLLYSAVINFSLILKAFELAIIVNGAAHAVSAISGWLRLTSRFRCHHH